MSSETEATHLARLKVTYPFWRISRTSPDAVQRGFIAVETATGRRILTATVGEMETRLLEQAQRAPR
jgi:hypothetical protein